MILANETPSTLSDLTIIISSSPSPTHPDTNLIDSVLESVDEFLNLSRIKIIFCLDAPKPNQQSAEIDKYKEFIQNLENRFRQKGNYVFIKQSEWGHLSGGLKNAIEFVNTNFVLVLQHDLPFIKHVDLEPLIQILKNESSVKRIEFTRDQGPCRWDSEPYYRRFKYHSKLFKVNGREIPLTKTLAWTDNNYLCSKEYVQDVIFGIIRDEKIFPEHALNLASSRLTANLLGTWRFGLENSGPFIFHTNGRFQENPSNLTSLRARIFYLNRLRIKTAIDRLKFRSRALVLILKKKNSQKLVFSSLAERD
jgi:hypothetical protein